jgi:hypothetical protein
MPNVGGEDGAHPKHLPILSSIASLNNVMLDKVPG